MPSVCMDPHCPETARFASRVLEAMRQEAEAAADAEAQQSAEAEAALVSELSNRRIRLSLTDDGDRELAI